MKKTKVIIPALGLLVLSTAASVTGTVAWFSANNRVNVSGMKVSTKVKGNLLIAANNSSDSNYSSSDLLQEVSGVLEPVSSINGIDFYYTKENVSGTGATTDVLLETYSTDSAFATYYDVAGAKAFVDYTFYVKATSDADNQKVIISKLNLLYNGSALGEEKAWRVAIFAQEVNENTAAAALASGQLKSIVAPAASPASLYFTSGQAYSTAGTAATQENPAVPAAKADVTNLAANANIGTIENKGTTQRFYVAVRLFLEGEDKTCNNDTFATLTEEYTLNLTCELSESNGANQLVSQAAAIATPSAGAVATVAKATEGLNDDLASYQWQKYNAGSWSDINGQTSATLAAQTADDVVRCKVVTAQNGTYYSNAITLIA